MIDTFVKSFKSRTMLVNGLTIIATLLGFATGTIETLAAHPTLVTGLFTATAAVNMVLRLITSEPIAAK